MAGSVRHEVQTSDLCSHMIVTDVQLLVVSQCKASASHIIFLEGLNMVLMEEDLREGDNAVCEIQVSPTCAIKSHLHSGT